MAASCTTGKTYLAVLAHSVFVVLDGLSFIDHMAVTIILFLL